jgi:hypothetical protein
MYQMIQIFSSLELCNTVQSRVSHPGSQSCGNKQVQFGASTSISRSIDTQLDHYSMGRSEFKIQCDVYHLCSIIILTELQAEILQVRDHLCNPSILYHHWAQEETFPSRMRN